MTIHVGKIYCYHERKDLDLVIDVIDSFDTMGDPCKKVTFFNLMNKSLYHMHVDDSYFEKMWFDIKDPKVKKWFKDDKLPRKK